MYLNNKIEYSNFNKPLDIILYFKRLYRNGYSEKRGKDCKKETMKK